MGKEQKNKQDQRTKWRIDQRSWRARRKDQQETWEDGGCWDCQSFKFHQWQVKNPEHWQYHEKFIPIKQIRR